MTERDNLQRHTIIALVEDRPGVLNRVASKWRQRGFNIESLAVGHSETAGLSRMTFVVDAASISKAWPSVTPRRRVSPA
ncbi:hypothetical protein LCGC14_1640870 [marine sediment metagenome]|uniref:ACT domain-containing protein n=1 Tax=marine sediment metagenome TaxID=412755 RepID=A0A0F9KZ87_9ZZZZ